MKKALVAHVKPPAQQNEKDQEVQAAPKKKTVAELDAELRQKLEARSGGGGEAGLEMEDGKPAALKRGVKENMFRVI
ncbi:hypothetical protein MMC10_010089 [Thelotrema lepadinum]|nr:hypothetical protein [Thelotrema lepadinum]